MKKRVLSSLLCAAIILPFTACGSSDSSDSSEATEEIVEDEVTEDNVDETLEVLDEMTDDEAEAYIDSALEALDEDTAVYDIEDESNDEDLISKMIVEIGESWLDENNSAHSTGTITNNSDVTVDLEVKIYANVTYLDTYGDECLEEGVKVLATHLPEEYCLKGALESFEPGETREYEIAMDDTEWSSIFYWSKIDVDYDEITGAELYFVITEYSESVEGESERYAVLSDWDDSTGTGTYVSSNGDEFELSYAVDDSNVISGTFFNKSDHYISEVNIRFIDMNSGDEEDFVKISGGTIYDVTATLSGIKPEGSEDYEYQSYGIVNKISSEYVILTYTIDVEKEASAE